MGSHPTPTAPISIENASFEDVRRSVTFHPCIWGDYFLTHASNTTELSASEAEEFEKQREEIRKLLIETPNDSLDKLELIDVIQRLGVAYHFESEICTSLKNIYVDTNYSEFNMGIEDNDLHMVALRFRLLRQQGHNILSDMFNKFKDHEGKFKESLKSNIQGMLSMYEASHFGVSGEEILDEALDDFSSGHLESMIAHVSDSSKAQIDEALNMPIQKSLTRLGVKSFMSFYQKDGLHNKTLLNFAKLDFNQLQKMHQQEVCEITRWWKELDFGNKMHFARNRIVEGYFWILSIYFEPQYHLARKLITKVIAMASIIDDIYDVHGTMNDLQLFTDAIERWELSALETLPPYMQLCYQALLDVYDEIENEMKNLETSYRLYYAKEEMKKMVRAYFQEAKWLYANYIPTMEEYMSVALVSAGYMMLSTTSLVGMGSDLVTKETFEWVTNEPLIVRASSTICRLMDDIVGHGFEQKFTSVDSYMKENGASKEETFHEFRKLVKKAWKDINQEFLHPESMPIPVLTRVLNFARVINLLYTDEDGYANCKTKLKEYIETVLVDPIKI